MASLVFLMIFLALWRAEPLHAGGGPENVAVVINTDSWASLAIANTFIQLRDIPAINVVYLRDLPGFERTSVDSFREKILTPVLEILKERKILSQIDCITYSADLPTAINVGSDLGDLKLPKVFTKVASINGLTYLYQYVLAKDPRYMQLNVNRYMRRPIRETRAKPIEPDDVKTYVEIMKLLQDKKWDEATEKLAPFAKKYPNNAQVQYNHACCLARVGKKDAAIKALTKAVDGGWADAKHAQKDEDLKPLGELDTFKQLLKRMEASAKAPFEVQPTMAFRSRTQWDPVGRKVDTGGRRYMLSTVLGVTSGRGNSVSEVVRALRRSAGADGTRPVGTIYYMVNSNIRSTTRKGAFPSAVKALKELRVNAEILDGTLPQAKDNVMGAMIGAASFHWNASNSTILPGAICEHLTSLGGVMREGSGQTPLTEFIRYGATGSSGTVTEPYAIQAKFPLAFIQVHYARGCSLAESFYQSVFGPYQLLIVGDPLCQPWARRIRVRLDGLKENQHVQATVSLTPRIEASSDTKQSIDRFELYVDGRYVSDCRPGELLKWDTKLLPDGWHQVTVVAVSAGLIETRSRIGIGTVVDNHGHRVTLANTGGAEVPSDEKILVRAAAANAQSIEIRQNERSLGTIQGAAGTCEIPARTTGFGQIRLQAVAHFQNGSAVSEPLELQVVPAPRLDAHTGPKKLRLSDGLLLKPEPGKPVIIQETKDRNWLEKLGMKSDQRFVLSGWFEVPADDVYQFQVRGNTVRAISVDGKRVLGGAKPERTAATWRMIPVFLRAGFHQLQLQGQVDKSPRLEVRFGGPGCTRLDGKRFRHQLDR